MPTESKYVWLRLRSAYVYNFKPQGDIDKRPN